MAKKPANRAPKVTTPKNKAKRFVFPACQENTKTKLVKPLVNIVWPIQKVKIHRRWTAHLVKWVNQGRVAVRNAPIAPPVNQGRVA